MGKTEVGTELDLNDNGGIYIPRRRRTTEKKPSTMSMVEAATILMAMAYSVTNVEAFCNQEVEKFTKCRKRKNRASTIPVPATKRKQRKKKSEQTEFPSVPEMPAAMRDRIVQMGGYEIQLVIQKQLQDTDLNKNHGRLSMPANKLRVDFATEEERKLLSEEENKNKKGMNVVMIDPVLRESVICLKKWKIGSGKVYCLMTQWNSFVEENGLRSGEHIQVWCFRKDEFEAQTQTMASRLCFAIVKLASS